MHMARPQELYRVDYHVRAFNVNLSCNYCDWQIIRTIFTYACVEDFHDFFDMRDGNSSSAPYIARIVTCYGAVHASINSTHNAVFLQFYSDSTINMPGVCIEYYTDSPGKYTSLITNYNNNITCLYNWQYNNCSKGIIKNSTFLWCKHFWPLTILSTRFWFNQSINQSINNEFKTTLLSAKKTAGPLSRNRCHVKNKYK